MGLLSGGQILAKKKYIFGAKEANDPNAVTTFDDSPGALKKKLRYLHNNLSSFLREKLISRNFFRAATVEITQDLPMDLQDKIVQEGVNVFKFNNTIIHTVEGVDEIFYKKLYKWIGILILIIAIIIAYFIF